MVIYFKVDDNHTDIDRVDLDKQAVEAERMFFEKCEKILSCLDKVNIIYGTGEDEDPRSILMKLQSEEVDVADKKELIDKLEMILSEALKTYIANKN